MKIMSLVVIGMWACLLTMPLAQETPKVSFPPLPEEPIKVIVIGSDQCQPCTLLQSVELPNLYKTGWNETQIVYHKAPVGLLPTVPLLLRYEGGVLKSSHTGYLPAVALTRFYYTGKVK